MAALLAAVTSLPRDERPPKGKRANQGLIRGAICC